MAGAREFFDRFSEEYEEQDRRRYLFYRWMIETILRQINREKSSILDLGAGTGELSIRIAKRFPKSNVVGLDISERMIRRARMRARDDSVKNLRFVSSPARGLRGMKVDFVVSNLAFHHMKDKKAVIADAYRVLPAGGRLIVGDWFRPSVKYREQVEEKRKKRTRRAGEFDDSWRQALKGMSRAYKASHPREYPVCPTRLRLFMKEVGFRKARIIGSLLPEFAVVVGSK